MNSSALLKIDPEQRTTEWWMSQSKEFTKFLFGRDLCLSDGFVSPSLPWRCTIPVYDPGIHSTAAIAKLLQSKLELSVWEGMAGRAYGGSEPSGVPQLHFTADCLSPTLDTLGKSVDDIKQLGKSYLRIRPYLILYGLVYSATGERLDTKGPVVFPDDIMPGPGRRWCVSFQTMFGTELRCSRHYNDELKLDQAHQGAREVVEAIPLKVVS